MKPAIPHYPDVLPKLQRSLEAEKAVRQLTQPSAFPAPPVQRAVGKSMRRQLRHAIPQGSVTLDEV